MSDILTRHGALVSCGAAAWTRRPVAPSHAAWKTRIKSCHASIRECVRSKPGRYPLQWGTAVRKLNDVFDLMHKAGSPARSFMTPAS